MKKRLMPLSFCFFMEAAEQKKPLYIKNAVEKEFPLLDENVFYDYAEYTFDSKKWNLVSIADRNFYEEEKVRYEKAYFVSDVSCIASRKDFTTGKVFKTESYDVFYDVKDKKPVINIRAEKCLETEIYEPDSVDIKNAKCIFCNDQKPIKKRIIFSAASLAGVLFFFVLQACISVTKIPETKIPEAALEAVTEETKEYDSFLKDFILCCSVFSKKEAKVLFYSETKENSIEVKVRCSTPSEVLESLQEEFGQVKLTAVNGTENTIEKGYECIFKLQGKRERREEERFTELEYAKTLEELCRNIEVLQKSKNTLYDITVKETTPQIKSFFEKYAELEKANEAGISSIELTAEEKEGLVNVHISFLPAAKTEGEVKDLESGAFEPLLDVFPKEKKKVIPVRTVKKDPPKEIEKAPDEIGRIKNGDGTIIIYRRTADGKMMLERRHE